MDTFGNPSVGGTVNATGNTIHNGSLIQSVSGSTKFSVDTSGNTVIAGTLSTTGNTTLNGVLTQSVGGSTKFSVDTSGNASIATSLCVATGSPYGTAVTTIYTPSANI